MYTRTLIFSLIISLFPLAATAQAVVTPSEAGAGTFQRFTLSAPAEKLLGMIHVRLVIPPNVRYVTPTVKPGWKIATTKDGAGNVTEINWTSGRVPAGQRDEFTFSARVPETVTTLTWKVYETYTDGSIISWDADPRAKQTESVSGASDISKAGPYSETRVMSGIATAPGNANLAASELASFVLAATALVVAGLALSRTKKRAYHHTM